MAKPLVSALLALLSLAAPASAGEVRFFDHNGSVMEIDFRNGFITYAKPKKSISRLVTPGTVLFEGSIREKGAASGKSYVFRKGCQPAGYELHGGYIPQEKAYILKGEAPVRAKKGCEVVGYSTTNSNSVLKFHPLDADTIEEAAALIDYMDQVYESESE